MANIVGNVEGSDRVIYIGTTENICVICGDEVPEGRECCLSCEGAILGEYVEIKDNGAKRINRM